MWLIDGTPALLTDLYELTMAQVYFQKRMAAPAYFEVTVRHLPQDWGFFVMAGLPEVEAYLAQFRFSESDLDYLRSVRLFEPDFLDYLAGFRPDVTIRALPEGTVFFPNEPILEVAGPILHAQLLESYILNILGFSIVEAGLAARMALAAGGVPLLDFGMRRAQGPIASIRAARGAQMAGWKATSNVFAARALAMPPSGTMAHSFIQAHPSQERAFREFATIYRDKTILLVDTYDTIEGVKIAARVAREFLERDVKLRGIRLDSGNLVADSRFARDHFRQQGVDFLQIFASGDLDEFKIQDMLAAGGQFDGFGVGTRFAVSRHAPSIGIIYKLVQYADRPLNKTSPDKATLPGRKTVLRTGSPRFEKDIVRPLDPDAQDLLRPFESAEPMATVQERLRSQIVALPDPVKRIREPANYPVQFAAMPGRGE
ncbi:MAG: nicotinate phosphoribosyltransferase [Sedimentisphaerales bacterium]|jgi:nicotinate phosphoribosyltransferase|nr:nicotinate phosphoribosyltransferase [Sedimentisphaerales bacterium]HNY79475.1 nicotinate phosphoribosyltransferase [Sedimentisphaerales bacterium]HOC64619.1 nicotinate phosphoribosyltransferase [Sedimentisphaerales bacterium]HOH65412.1 nicotinate phosphoribosyltransferase [Sedimentisphaerales bacterium]HQA91751.1 nicotinate phosphoribosyltransferase [Sedimentisphaerales bacterium]